MGEKIEGSEKELHQRMSLFPPSEKPFYTFSEEVTTGKRGAGHTFHCFRQGI
jgi:hypothetical protein